MAHKNCTEVTLACPVELTTYGYYPNLTANAVLLGIFGLAALAQVLLGLRYRLPSFGIVVSIGCIMEAVGYGGRIMMHSNPWNRTAFQIQIVCLILAPSFLAAGIYLTLKHIVLALGPNSSRLRPQLYTWIFISCDVFSIILQAAGGALAASTQKLVNTGNTIMIAGIAFQVATMFVCLLLAIDFGLALWRNKRRGGRQPDLEKNQAESKALDWYIFCFSVAFIAIFVRCVYRIPEMAGGWGNPLMQNELEFLILDGAMIALACILMTFAHPGIFFPAMRMHRQDRKSGGHTKSSRSSHKHRRRRHSERRHHESDESYGSRDSRRKERHTRDRD